MNGNGKVGIVTGAGSGVGRATALTLLNAGYSIVLAGRRADALERTVKEAGPASERALAVPTDVTEPASVRALFGATRARFERLDLLFNNAGTNAPGIPLEDLSLEQWKKVVDTNLTGLFLCTQEAFRMMKDQTPRGGRIVNNGTIAVEPLIDVQHVADAVLHMASLPLDANVLSLTIMATKMPFVGRG